MTNAQRKQNREMLIPILEAEFERIPSDHSIVTIHLQTAVDRGMDLVGQYNEGDSLIETIEIQQSNLEVRLMPYTDLRHFLGELAKRGELLVVDKAVDTDLEIGDIIRKINDFEGPAVHFRNLKGYPGWTLVANVLGSLERTALAMETTVDRMIPEYVERMRNVDEFKPVLVPRDEALCKDVILKGEQIDCWEIPICKWHPRDGGRYIGFGIQITKDPDSGVPNASIVRQMVQKRDQISILLQNGKHTAIHYFKKNRKGEPLDFAAAIGLDPVLSIVGCHNGPLDEDEFAVAGALRREPVRMVKCETVDVEVPAFAELIIEGLIMPGEVAEEGPFGEFSGFYTSQTKFNPYVKVTCITHRRDPIYQGTLEGRPPNEDNIFHSLPYSASILAEARVSCPGLTAFYMNPYGSGFFYGVASIKKMYPAHAHQAMHAIWASQGGKFLKQLIVVDDYINVYDPNDVTWAVATRTRAERDVLIEPGAITSLLDPAVFPRGGVGSKLGIDATDKWPQEGAAPAELAYSLIDHSESPYWAKIEEVGLDLYLGVDLAPWLKYRAKG